MRGTKETRCATDTDANGNVYTVDCGYDSLFSLQDMAVNDLPAFVDDVLARTGEETLTVMGFSRGTAQTLTGLATLGDDLQSKVSQAVLLAPCLWGEMDLTIEEQNAWTAWRSGVMGINNTRPDQVEDHIDLFCNPPKQT